MLNNFLENYFSNYKWFKTLILLIIVVLVVISIISFSYTFKAGDFYDKNFCPSSKCVDYFVSEFSGTFKIIRNGIYFLWVFSAVSGVYIALMNYLVSVKSAALSGHVSHINLFKSYIESEVSKKNGLALSKIDLFYWYREIFPHSVDGDVSVASSYVKKIKAVSDCIDTTNKTITGQGDQYCYKLHQTRLIESFGAIGIDMPRLPKNDFFSLETQVLALVDSANLTFVSGMPDIKRLNVKRKYL